LELSLCVALERMGEIKLKMPKAMLELLKKWREAVAARLESEQSQVTAIQRFYSVVTVLEFSIKTYEKRTSDVK